MLIKPSAGGGIVVAWGANYKASPRIPGGGSGRLATMPTERPWSMPRRAMPMPTTLTTRTACAPIYPRLLLKTLTGSRDEGLSEKPFREFERSGRRIKEFVSLSKSYAQDTFRKNICWWFLGRAHGPFLTSNSFSRIMRGRTVRRAHHVMSIQVWPNTPPLPPTPCEHMGRQGDGYFDMRPLILCGNVIGGMAQ